MPEMAPFDVDVITDTSWQNYTQIVFELNYWATFWLAHVKCILTCFQLKTGATLAR